MRKRGEWSPFNRRGKLRLTFYTDPWWKRLWAKVRGEPLWHRTGAMTEGEVTSGD